MHPKLPLGSYNPFPNPARLTIDSVSSLAALGKCKNLRHLDLSFVSEALDPSDLARSFKNMIQLGFLSMPRAGKIGLIPFIESFPPNLRECHLNCGLQSNDYRPVHGIPPTQPNLTVTRLVLQDCLSQMSPLGFWGLVTCLPNLDYLKLGPPTAKRGIFLVGDLILSLNHLQYLHIPIDFVGRGFFWGQHVRSRENPSSLVTVELDRGFPLDQEETIDIDSIWDAVTEGAFPNLRRIGLHRSLDSSAITGLGESAEELDQLLKAFAREDGDQAKCTEDLAGVYTFDD